MSEKKELYESTEELDTLEDVFDESTEDENVEDDQSIRTSDNRENAIEWYNGNDRVTVTLSQRRLITIVKKYAADYPQQVQIVAENDDGTILAHIPLSYIRIRKPKQVSEEFRQTAAERMQKLREEGKLKRKK